MADREKIFEAERQLSNLLDPHLSQVVDLFKNSAEGNPYHVLLPDTDTVDLPMEELASLVARTSNAFSRAARFAGIARAQAKLAKGRFERVYKKTRSQGRNDTERAANAMTAAEVEHAAMVTAEAIAEIADAYESAARIASESVRKIFDKAGNVIMGQIREAHGAYKDQDFQPY